MADQVNIDLLGQAYCNVMTRKTGIKHTYTIKGKDDKKQNEKSVADGFYHKKDKSWASEI